MIKSLAPPLCIVLLSYSFLAAQEESAGAEESASQMGFLHVGEWWNFYFVSDHDPLKRGNMSVRAVKVIGLDKLRPSWVKIRFPTKVDEHLSILNGMRKAQDNEAVTLKAALDTWEKTVTGWTTKWVNLRYVVHITEVKLKRE